MTTQTLHVETHQTDASESIDALLSLAELYRAHNDVKALCKVLRRLSALSNVTR